MLDSDYFHENSNITKILSIKYLKHTINSIIIGSSHSPLGIRLEFFLLTLKLFTTFLEIDLIYVSPHSDHLFEWMTKLPTPRHFSEIE